jgi:outer membrane protein assembly factor BamB
VLQTNQVMYTSPTIAPDGTVIYGASGGGIARAVSSVGKQLWELDLGLFASTMGAITHDGNHVLLANSSGLCKVEIATGSAVWTSDHESRIASAGIAVDSTGVAFVPNGHGISYTKSDGSNTTNCDLPDPSGSGYNSMVQLTIAGDGMILQLSIHGMMKALVG